MIDDNAKHKVRNLITQLENIKGRHTELVSVYIPAGYSIIDISNQIKLEQGTAENIKSKSTRKNVVDALEKIIQHLKLYKQTPPNGLIIFSGNISEKEGVSDIKLWAIEPPEPNKVKLYWCDQRFELGPLYELVKEKDVYGLLVLDTKEATFGFLRGKNIQAVRTLHSVVPGKFIKGGQSQMRFQRVREGMINDFYKEIANVAKSLFGHEIKGIIIGGPGPSKNDFYDGDYLPADLKKKILGIKDIGYTDENGLNELVERSKDLLLESSLTREKDIVDKFFTHLQKGTGLVTYGIFAVKKAIEAGAVDVVLLSDGLEWDEVEVVCSCGVHKTFVKSGHDISMKCATCGQQPKILGRRPAIDSFEELAKNYGSALEIISRESREGKQFYEMGGIGAMLRWKIE